MIDGSFRSCSKSAYRNLGFHHLTLKTSFLTLFLSATRMNVCVRVNVLDISSMR